ncbi:hypothetical protein CGRA01v4_07146 [Colletotrichum graminicola]|nr:hypothetical protein CGRA01v4_07146 [Colletotrichum graminicola]
MDSFGGHRGTAFDPTPMTLLSLYLFPSNKPSGRFSRERSTRRPGTKQPGPFASHQLSPSPHPPSPRYLGTSDQAGAKSDWL